MLAAALGLSLAMGIVLGALGGGGSVLCVPILVYILHYPAKLAIGTSLFVVGTTSLVATWSNARLGSVRWITGATFGPAAMVGAYGGGLLAQHLPGRLLLCLFAALMLIVGALMLRGGVRAASVDAAPSDAPGALSTGKLAPIGLAVGGLTGLVGAGGGFIIVPALIYLAKFPTRAAIGTSLLIITMNAFAALVGHLQHLDFDWPVAGAIAATATAGALAGVRLARRLNPALLKRAFGGFVMLMGGLMLVQNL